MYDILSFDTDITEKKVFTFDNRIMGELTHKLRTYGKNVKKAMTLPQKLKARNTHYYYYYYYIISYPNHNVGSDAFYIFKSEND